MKALVPILVSVAVFLSAATAQSAQADKTPQEIESLAEVLVRKLGDPKFQEREAAGRELAKLGVGAIKAIEAGRKNPDPEIRARCERLLPIIRTLDLKSRIEEFAADNEGRSANTLPLGANFAKICGNDANARKFYIEICKNNLQMLEEAANNPKAMGEAYFDLVNEILIRRNGVLSVETEVAALLLIGADEKIAPCIDEANRAEPKGDRNYQRLIGQIWTPKYEAVMTDANNGPYFRKLLFAWGKQMPESGMQSFLFFVQDMINKQVMNLQPDSDTLEFLRDFATSTSAQRLPYQKGTAMEMLAASSLSKNDLIRYFEEEHLKDQTTLLPGIVFDSKGPTKIMVETRACDYALAVCVKLTGQSFADYGFDVLGSRSDMFESWVYAGFTNDETRRAAIKKYVAWRKANPG